MGVSLEQEKFDECQEARTLIIWYLDFTGDEMRWPGIAETFCLHAERPNYVGRAVAKDECPLSDPRISRRHAMLKVTEKGLELTDLESANGTFVNGVRVKETVVLNIDDRVIFDRIPFRIRRSLNLPELPFDELDDEQPAGFARRRLIEARRQRLAGEGKLSSLDLNSGYDQSPDRYKLRSRYATYKPVMLGSALALLVASIIIYLL
jgi:hypothetical protein